ncbi:MAG: acetyl-CoA carboxylase biotin carboxyl carrier protein subunit [Proteobacteria bacterium]|nr:acetyl-CoA carboxylase biotin carboxyl carrier protein subunit [Pseudomonadota bacterium]
MRWHLVKHKKNSQQESAVICMVTLPDGCVSSVNHVLMVGKKNIGLRWDEKTQVIFLTLKTSDGLSLEKPVWCTGLKVDTLEGGEYHLRVEIPYGGGLLSAIIEQQVGEYHPLKVRAKTERAKSEKPQHVEIRSSITGRVVQVNVKEGKMIKERDCLVIIEAMKMENKILASCSGVVQRIDIKEGDGISRGKLLCVIDESPSHNPIGS